MIGQALDDAKARAHALELAQHRGAIVDVSIEIRVHRGAAGEEPKVGARLVVGVGDARRLLEVVGADPERAERIGAAAAERVRFLDQADAQSRVRARERCSAAGGSGTDADQVELGHLLIICSAI